MSNQVAYAYLESVSTLLVSGVNQNIKSGVVGNSSLSANASKGRSSEASIQGGSDFLAATTITDDTLTVVSATAVNPTTVVVRFSSPLDGSYTPHLNPLNYAISGISVISVTGENDSVIITTSLQGNSLYTVTVASALSLLGEVLNSSLNTASFQGAAYTYTMEIVAVSPRKVRVLFNSIMLNDGNLNNTGSYVVKDMFGNTLSVDSVTPEQPSNISSVALILHNPLNAQGTYQVDISSSVHTTTGHAINPSTVAFTWVDDWIGPGDRPGLPDTHPIIINVSEFTGEVSGGLFGNPMGQVYFSPALDFPADNSVIQVEEVEVCTYAYDTYTFPQPPLPPQGLYTYGLSSVPNPGNVLGLAVLNGLPALLNNGTQIDLTDYQTDIVPYADDVGCSLYLLQTWNPLYVALLNDPAWVLFKNRDSIMRGVGSLTAHPSTHYLVAATLDGGSVFSGHVLAEYEANASLSGESLVIEGPYASLSLSGSSSMVATGGTHHNASASLDSYSFLLGEVNQPFPLVPPYVFICAGVLSPIPPAGPSQVIVLKNSIRANSSFDATII